MSLSKSVTFITQNKGEDSESINYLKSKNKLIQTVEASDTKEIVKGTDHIICNAPLTKVWNYIKAGNKLKNLIIIGGFIGDNIIKSELVPEEFKGKTEIPDGILSADTEASRSIFSTEKEQIQNIYLLGSNIRKDLQTEKTLLSREAINLFDSENKEYLLRYINANPDYNAIHDTWGSKLYLMQAANRPRSVKIAIGVAK